jgi:hypothetical protein
MNLLFRDRPGGGRSARWLWYAYGTQSGIATLHGLAYESHEGAKGRGMDSLDYWRLCDELSVIQAALLTAGCDPSSDHGYVESWDLEKRPPGYEAAKTAISNALRRGAIIGRLVPIYEHDINGNACGAIEDSVDLVSSRIEVDSLREWLAGRGFKTGFFFPKECDFGNYLDPRHPRYAPKLAAAVLAWRATENESSISGKSPK